MQLEYEDGSEQLHIQNRGPVGSFLWFLTEQEVVNQRQPNLPKGALNGKDIACLEAVTNLDEYSRARSFSKKEREVFADLLAAKDVLGPLARRLLRNCISRMTKPIRGGHETLKGLSGYWRLAMESNTSTITVPNHIGGR